MPATKKNEPNIKRMLIRKVGGGLTTIIIYQVFRYLGLTCCLHQDLGQIVSQDQSDFCNFIIYAVSEYTTGVQIWSGRSDQCCMLQSTAIDKAKIKMYDNRKILWINFKKLLEQKGTINE
jgi:hypothetical protein